VRVFLEYLIHKQMMKSTSLYRDVLLAVSHRSTPKFVSASFVLRVHITIYNFYFGNEMAKSEMIRKSL
jgi:hypothetical protein